MKTFRWDDAANTKPLGSSIVVKHCTVSRRLGRVYHTRHAGYFTRVLPVPDPWVAWVWPSKPYPRVGYLGFQNQSLPGYRVRGPGTTRVEYPRRSGNTLYTLPNVPDPWVTYSIRYPRVGYIGYQNQSLPGYRVRTRYYPGRVPRVGRVTLSIPYPTYPTLG